MARDIRDSFQTASDFYGYRVPYHPRFFTDVSAALNCHSDTTVLDICCGLGQLSVGLCGHIGRAVAVDFSEQMISRAVKHDRIEYLHYDINSNTPAPASISSSTFNHFVIGRAIHWIERDKLQTLAHSSLDQDGSIVICGASFSAENPWLSAFTALREAFSHREPRKDYTGKEKPCLSA